MNFNIIYKDWLREDMDSPPAFRGAGITNLFSFCVVLCCVSINVCCVLNVASVSVLSILHKTQNKYKQIKTHNTES